MSLFPAYQTVKDESLDTTNNDGDHKKYESKFCNTPNPEDKDWTRNESYNLQTSNLHTGSKENIDISFSGTLINRKSLGPENYSSSFIRLFKKLCFFFMAF